MSLNRFTFGNFFVLRRNKDASKLSQRPSSQRFFAYGFFLLACLLACFAAAVSPARVNGQSFNIETLSPVAASQGPDAQIDSRPHTPLSASTQKELRKLFKESIGGSRVRLPDAESIESFRQLMNTTLQSDQITTELSDRWKQAGWNVTTLNDSNVAVIQESTGNRHGRGLYIVRLKSRSNIVLQAPHRFFDAKTGVIARLIFERHDVRAVGINTAHRKELDLAHCDRHYFNAFTKATIKAIDNTLIFQLHGFTNEKKTNARKTASMIVSDTTRFPSRLARHIATDFKSTFGEDHSLLYGVETRWLGGTKNEQAETAHNLGSIGFIHLEMNAEFRNRLANSAKTRKRFFECMDSTNPQSKQRR